MQTVLFIVMLIRFIKNRILSDPTFSSYSLSSDQPPYCAILEQECDSDIATMYYEKAGRQLDDLYREYQNLSDKTGNFF